MNQEPSQNFTRSYDSSYYPAEAKEVDSVTSILLDPVDSKKNVGGRVLRKRDFGNLAFLTLVSNGEKYQVSFQKRDFPSKQEYRNAIGSIVPGDIITGKGTTYDTKTGERTVAIENFEISSRALRPLPDKHEGLKDPEARVRKRSLDLVVNEESRRVATNRSKSTQVIRNYLLEERFDEFETPILQSIYGGANARPFTTTFNAHDDDLAYLRISNELYLKRLVAGGFDRVFEFAKDFRNEGIDRTHNPEFTQLELYEAFADYYSMRKRAKDLITVAAESIGKSKFQFLGNTIDLEGEWDQMTMEQSLTEIGGVSKDLLNDRERFIYHMKERGVVPDSETAYGIVLSSAFEEFVEPYLIHPTFIMDFPIEVSPLAKSHREKPEFAERFELYIGGKEFGNAYSELNDPIEQRNRFIQQEKNKENGDEESHPIDEEFLEIMEYGMPPMGGFGIGIDRLNMLISEKDSIRDVILFPFKKRK